MNPARSAEQGGSCCSGRSFHDLPAFSTWSASLRSSAMRPSRRHEPFASGSSQTVPVQARSCQGTRMERCWYGSVRALMGSRFLDDLDARDGDKARVAVANGTSLELSQLVLSFFDQLRDKPLVSSHIRLPHRDHASRVCVVPLEKSG